MAAVTITATAVPAAAGYNLTDSADFTTLTTGAGNGVDFTYDSKDLIVLKNASGFAATVTLKLGLIPSAYTTYSVTPADPTLAIADGKTYLFKAADVFKDSSGKFTIECDQAIDCLVVDVN